MNVIFLKHTLNWLIRTLTEVVFYTSTTRFYDPPAKGSSISHNLALTWAVADSSVKTLVF